MRLRLRIPATTANIGPGFDTFGMALNHYNYVTVASSPRLSVSIKGEGAGFLSANKHNLVVRAAQLVYDAAGAGLVKLAFEMENHIPLSRGLGSSAAAIVGGLVAANHALDFPLTQDELLQLAIKLEGHPDNVAPALLGGFVVSCREGNGYQTLKILPPSQLRGVAVVPEIRISTEKARGAIPKEVPLEDAVFNLCHGVMLALFLQKGDIPGFARMLKDKLHQPYRFPLIPASGEVVSAALDAGALGCVISGSGSTMIAFTETSLGNDKAIGAAMSKAFKKEGIKAHYLSLQPDNCGVKIMADNLNVEECL